MYSLKINFQVSICIVFHKKMRYFCNGILFYWFARGALPWFGIIKHVLSWLWLYWWLLHCVYHIRLHTLRAIQQVQLACLYIRPRSGRWKMLRWRKFREIQFPFPAQLSKQSNLDLLWSQYWIPIRKNLNGLPLRCMF